MSDPFHIVTVQPRWMLRDEAMGTKSKFWYRELNGGGEWLFKYAQENTGQHWAEKIAAEVADTLRTYHARVELAEFEGWRGTVTESFAREGRELRHGNEILAITVSDYDSRKRFHQSKHTLDNIWPALDRVFPRHKPARRAKLLFADYLLLDALIGNTDRHHANWRLLVRRVKGGFRGFLAPSFDHASSLGRELVDERRNRFLAEGHVGGYSERGRGGIYWSADETYGPSPVELVRRAAGGYPELFRSALVKMRALREDDLDMIVERVPAAWMSSSAREFAVGLMKYNLDQLRSIRQ